MMGTITVYFKNLPYDGHTYYHEFIVWSSDQMVKDVKTGKLVPVQRYIRGGPNSRLAFGSGSGGGSGALGFGSFAGGPNVPFGSIEVEHGVFDLQHTSDFAAPDADPEQVLITGPDSELGPMFQTMVIEGDKINKQNIPYGFPGPNSNTVSTTLLQSAGLPLPKHNGLEDAYPAPGADMSLLNGHYSALEGYRELAENAAERAERNELCDFEAGLAAIKQEAKALIGKTPVERLRYYKAQALANAAKKPVPEHMKLYHALMKHIQPQRSFAPIPQRRGQQQGYAPPRPGMEEAGVAASTVRSAAAQGEQVAGGSGAAPGEALTGYRAVIAAAKAQAAAAREQREAEREAIWHPRLPGSVLDRPMAPIGLSGGGRFGPRAAAREGGILEQYVATQTSTGGDAAVAGRGAGLDAASGELRPRAAQQTGAEAGRRAEVAGLEAASVSAFDLKHALEMYFLRQSRLPPAGGAGFDPRLTPAWAGVKLPG